MNITLTKEQNTILESRDARFRFSYLGGNHRVLCEITNKFTSEVITRDVGPDEMASLAAAVNKLALAPLPRSAAEISDENEKLKAELAELRAASVVSPESVSAPVAPKNRGGRPRKAAVEPAAEA